jgi:hypothetical protein
VVSVEVYNDLNAVVVYTVFYAQRTMAGPGRGFVSNLVIIIIASSSLFSRRLSLLFPSPLFLRISKIIRVFLHTIHPVAFEESVMCTHAWTDDMKSRAIKKRYYEHQIQNLRIFECRSRLSCTVVRKLKSADISTLKTSVSRQYELGIRLAVILSIQEWCSRDLFIHF